MGAIGTDGGHVTFSLLCRFSMYSHELSRLLAFSGRARSMHYARRDGERETVVGVGRDRRLELDVAWMARLARRRYATAARRKARGNRSHHHWH